MSTERWLETAYLGSQVSYSAIFAYKWHGCLSDAMFN
jgi:hypothetical protein